MIEVIEQALRSRFLPDEDFYRRKCRNTLTDFISKDFLAIPPMNQENEQLLEDLKKRSMDQFVDNPNNSFVDCTKTFCRTLTYKDNKTFSFTKESLGNDVDVSYNSILLTPEYGSRQIFVNHSQFIYPDLLYDGCKGVPPQNKVCTIDSSRISPQGYFEDAPIKLLECYRFNTYFQDYNTTKVCRRFINITGLMETQICDLLRKEILKAQAFTLNYILKYPIITVMPYFENGAISTLNKTVWFDEFENSLRQMFQDKLEKIELILTAHDLSYEKI